MKTRFKYIIAATTIIAATLAYFGYQYMFPEQRNILEEEVAFTLAPESLNEAFQAETQGLDYIDQVVQTTGKVTEFDSGWIVLDNHIQANLLPSNIDAPLSKDMVITIKGRCVGYDELLELVKVDQATIILY
ncbi:MAG: hypothetical protein AAGD88_08400 [Bacteroidota bacterium]